MSLKRKSTQELVGMEGPEGSGRPPKERKKKKERTQTGEARARIALPDLVRSRAFAGVSCILAGLLAAFVVSPLLQARVARTERVVVLARETAAGTVLTADLLTVQERGAINLPGDVLRTPGEAEGRYLAVAGAHGDILTASRLADRPPSDDPALAALPEGKLAMSAALLSLEQSVSGKLRAGDVIQLFAVEEDRDAAGGFLGRAVPEIQRMLVLCVTNSAGGDVATGDLTPDADRQAVTAILAVNAEQAAVLAGLSHSATLHAALVTRGDNTAAEAALSQQEDYFTHRREDTQADTDSLEPPQDGISEGGDGA
jgi:Flp pilus assembly protein CpaB